MNELHKILSKISDELEKSVSEYKSSDKTAQLTASLAIAEVQKAIMVVLLENAKSKL